MLSSYVVWIALLEPKPKHRKSDLFMSLFTSLAAIIMLTMQSHWIFVQSTTHTILFAVFTMYVHANVVLPFAFCLFVIMLAMWIVEFGDNFENSRILENFMFDQTHGYTHGNYIKILDELNACHQFLDDVLCNRQIYVLYGCTWWWWRWRCAASEWQWKVFNIRTIYEWNVRHKQWKLPFTKFASAGIVCTALCGSESIGWR